jgi:cell division protein FtsQ
MARPHARSNGLIGLPRAGVSRFWRVAVRLSAVAILGLAVGRGLVLGGHLDYEGSPWPKLPGLVAGLAGYAADDIRIDGLTNHEPENLLAAIGVTPGGSLVGFDAALARRTLENLDWVREARVQRIYPNRLEVSVIERQPFAIWQRGQSYYAIDASAVAMSGIPSGRLAGLPLVTGEGAPAAAAELINQLEVTPGIRSHFRAAARVGMRRWTLYLDNGVTVLLPERGWERALATVEDLNGKQQLLAKGIVSIDLRLADRIAVAVAKPVGEQAAVE